MRLHRLQHLEHDLLRLADREAANRETVKIHVGERARALDPQRLHRAALHDAERRLPRRAVERLARTLGPAQRQPHRALGFGVAARQPHAFVELHLYVGAEQRLNLHRALGRQHMLGAVDVRLEGDAVLIELTQLGQRHHLKAAGIRQDRIGPAHEVVQPTKPVDPLRAGAQHQMIDIAEQYIGAGGAHILGEHRLDRRRRADRHEGRRANCSTRRRYLAFARGAVGRVNHE